MLFLFVLSSAIMSRRASLTQLCVACVCMPAVCLLYFHVSHWLISMLVIAIATMRWHMPASWLSDWQDHRRGEIQRMLEQITPRPFTSSEGQSACPSFLPPLFRSFTASFSKRLTQNKTWRSPALQTQTDQDEMENMLRVMAGHKGVNKFHFPSVLFPFVFRNCKCLYFCTYVPTLRRRFLPAMIQRWCCCVPNKGQTCCTWAIAVQSLYILRLVHNWFHTKSISSPHNTPPVEQNNRLVSAHETTERRTNNFSDTTWTLRNIEKRSIS